MGKVVCHLSRRTPSCEDWCVRDLEQALFLEREASFFRLRGGYPIFPLALLFARTFNIDFMRDKTAVMDALFPAFVSMLLFWPIAISAYWTYPQLVPLVLAIGMSIHWPVIGWTYGRTAIRAAACFVLWNWWPSTRFTVLPYTVSAIYCGTVCAISLPLPLKNRRPVYKTYGIKELPLGISSVPCFT
jgi:hypothetical protein